MVKTTNELDFIAEIGINHEGSLSLAKELICAAKESGATIAKFQTYKTQKRAKRHPEIYDILKKSELNIDQFSELKSYCNEVGIIFSSSPFCNDSVKELDLIKTSHLKVASFLLSDSNLLKEILNTQNCTNLYLSTGTCNLSEIKKSVKLIKNFKNKAYFLHCISQYPVSDLKDCNLANIQQLKAIWGDNIGLSDHSIGSFIPSLAIVLGAKIIEKHFTTSEKREGFDHPISATPEIFKELVDNCKSALLSLGKPRGDNNYKCENPIMKFKEVS